MADSEIESFLTKFKHLCSAGINASLNLSCAHGKAIVTLHAEIGMISSPSKVSLTPPSKHRSPAYHRRIARRQAMRQATDENQYGEAAEVSLLNDQHTMNLAVKPDLTEVVTVDAEKSSESGVNDISAEEVSNVDKSFDCEEKEVFILILVMFIDGYK